MTRVEDELAVEWEALADVASEPNSYSEYWFFRAALRHFRSGETVRLAMVRDETGCLAGILPLVSSAQYGRLPVANTSNWVHLQCYCGGPLIREGCEEGFWAALLDFLDHSKWADNMLTLRLIYANGPVRRGLDMAAKASGRALHVAQTYDRATLNSDADSEAYIAKTVRSKKRKEYRRQAKRLSELGAVRFERLALDQPVAEWCDQYLELEAAGWKGEGGTALGAAEASSKFFRQIMSEAHALGRVDFLRLMLDDRPIAMLVNLRSPPAVWSYKITYDESLARFSPGVLIELETIALVLGDPDISRADSCAKPDHPMINSIWGERQTIDHITISLKGPIRRSAYYLCRSVDQLGAFLRRKRNHDNE
ncbi:GNAT family N-acetyltransferase [Parasphingorhabdus halotolerans]|uniref:GNAT family N-acetyltransferase n=1 Tax=Parasphingorhabdus halotolerans TaxID=2725558 RepID=A0A6H2DJJ9_9SPHN|nr:GNAT family N-acetyltransferase [Parasphingorhabdus halotolerans]QJB68163.1 GNAT family N-acetyltransferase [Parasphingorhabdus halotolerans]